MKISSNHYSYLFSIANGIIPLALISALTYRNGAGFMGEYFYALSLITMCQVLVDYGFNLTAIRTVSELYKEFGGKVQFWDNVVGVVCAKILLVIPIFFALCLLLFLGVMDVNIAIYFMIGAFLSVVDISWFFYGINASIYNSVCLFLLRLVFLVPILLMEQSTNSALVYSLLPLLLSPVLALCLVYVYINEVFKCKVRLIRPNPLTQLKDGWNMFANSFFAILAIVKSPMSLPELKLLFQIYF